MQHQALHCNSTTHRLLVPNIKLVRVFDDQALKDFKGLQVRLCKSVTLDAWKSKLCVLLSSVSCLDSCFAVAICNLGCVQPIPEQAFSVAQQFTSKCQNLRRHPRLRIERIASQPVLSVRHRAYKVGGIPNLLLLCLCCQDNQSSCWMLNF